MKYLLLLILFLLLTGCGTLCIDTNKVSAPPDFLICTTIDANSGGCGGVLTKTTVLINDTNLYMGMTWAQVLATSTIIPNDQWVNAEQWLVGVCEKVGCTTTVINSIKAAFKRLDYSNPTAYK